MENLLPLTENMPFYGHDALWLLSHPLWGAAFFCLLNHFVHAESDWQARMREPRWATVLASVGLFSYSLYLVHEAILMQMWRFWILRQSWLVTSLMVIIPLAVAGSWAFFWLFERPFLNPPQK
jgi:peptidoglycan/LPS O-acetylase OafA/YrhL